MSLLCRELCLKVHLPADWNLGFFVRILQNQIFQTSHRKNAGIFLRGKEDQYLDYIPLFKKRSSWDHLRVLAGHKPIHVNITSTKSVACCMKEVNIRTYGFFSLNPVYQTSVLSTAGGVGSHLGIARWGIRARWWKRGSRLWSLKGERD